jgi:hypothetical protein
MGELRKFLSLERQLHPLIIPWAFSSVTYRLIPPFLLLSQSHELQSPREERMPVENP